MDKYANNWKKLNPEYEIKLYDNEMCEQFILNEYGELHRDIFKFINDGPIMESWIFRFNLLKYVMTNI